MSGEEWFDRLGERLRADEEPPAGSGEEVPLGPGEEETRLLLEMGKVAAAAAPQRYYALLTAFAVGRALGRAERADPRLDRIALLRDALAVIEEIAG